MHGIVFTDDNPGDSGGGAVSGSCELSAQCGHQKVSTLKDCNPAITDYRWSIKKQNQYSKHLVSKQYNYNSFLTDSLPSFSSVNYMVRLAYNQC